MKSKLIKTEVNYLLENDKGVVIASTSTKEGNNKLSKQNCDNIFQSVYYNSQKGCLLCGNGTLINEIEVEIEMEHYVKYVPKTLETVYPMGGVRPKLDPEGCLILKIFKKIE